MSYESTLSEVRKECCDKWPKPCTYHEGYADGYEHAERDTTAPNMLEALEAYWAYWTEPVDVAPILSDVRSLRDAALAKAKGE